MRPEKPIGIFDSGLGGLTVVREIRRQLPGEDIVYLGDTARVPYGTKSKEAIERFATEDVEFLRRHEVKLAVVACGTASSVALSLLLEESQDVPILDVFRPGVRAAVRTTKTNRIGVIGTTATVGSGRFEEAIQRNGHRVIRSVACPLFVPLVEEGLYEGEIADKVAEMYLGPLKEEVDTLVLACTHYPLLKGTIRKAMGPSVRLVDPAQETAKETQEYLLSHDAVNPTDQRGRVELFLTDLPPHYRDLIELFLGEMPDRIERVEI
jgi:glutamate racemase